MGPSAKRHRCAVIAGIPRHAPSANDAVAGSVIARRAGTHTYSAAVPYGRSHCTM